jgi:hypothetical protein
MSPKPRSRKQVLEAMPSANRGDRRDVTFSRPCQVGLGHVDSNPETGKEAFITPGETHYRQEVAGEFQGRATGPPYPVIDGLGSENLGGKVLSTLQRFSGSVSFPGGRRTSHYSAMSQTHLPNLHHLSSSGNTLQCVHGGYDRADCRACPAASGSAQGDMQQHHAGVNNNSSTAPTSARTPTASDDSDVDRRGFWGCLCCVRCWKVWDAEGPRYNGPGNGEDVPNQHESRLGSLSERFGGILRLFQLWRVPTISRHLPVRRLDFGFLAPGGGDADYHHEESPTDVQQLPEGCTGAPEGARDHTERPIHTEYSRGTMPTTWGTIRRWLRALPPQSSTSSEPKTRGSKNECYGEASRTTSEATEDLTENNRDPDARLARTSKIDEYEAGVLCRLAEVGWKAVREEEVSWGVFMEWGARFRLSPVTSGHLKERIEDVHDIDVGEYIDDVFELQRGDLIEVLGNYDWYFLISTSNHLIFGLETEGLNLFICGYCWSTAYETAETYWSRGKDLQPLILATRHNRERYQGGWRPIPKPEHPREYV